MCPFQAFAGLEQTGELTAETVELMNTPRCGVGDHIGHGANAKRKKRYALQGSRWSRDTLTYRITKYPSTDRLSKSEVDSQIKEGFTLWERQTNLKFEEKSSGSVHIEIRFEKREHGDGDPFDGAGGTLAHAYFPQFGGDAHFDDEEYWTIDSFRGTNLLQTAAHEFGHSLGLSHSDVRDALMAPFYRGWVPNLELHSDDIAAIQALYGKKTKEEEDDDPPRTPENPDDEDENDDGDGGRDPPSNGDNADLCDDTGFDTIFNIADGTYFVFKGSNYWKLTDDSVERGYPRKIADDWAGLPDNVDAAVTWPANKKTYIFKGSEYWRFENQEADPGYPKQISEGFKGIPNNLDAAFIWGGNGKIYFFKNDEYWKFDPTKRPPVRSVYPRPVSNWELPNGVVGAVQWSNKYTYFFTRDSYYRFNDRRFSLDRGEPGFPRKTGPWWFGCTSDSSFSPAQAKKEAAAISLFDDEGDELLDVVPGDEDKK